MLFFLRVICITSIFIVFFTAPVNAVEKPAGVIVSRAPSHFVDASALTVHFSGEAEANPDGPGATTKELEIAARNAAMRALISDILPKIAKDGVESKNLKPKSEIPEDLVAFAQEKATTKNTTYYASGKVRVEYECPIADLVSPQ